MAIRKLPPDDLRDLKTTLVMSAWSRLLIGRFKRKPGSLLARNVLRLIDRSIIDYQCAYRELDRFISKSAIDTFFRAQGHLESCVVNMHRLLVFTGRLRREGFLLPDGRPLVPRHELEILSTSVLERIRRLRDAITHMDNRLAQGKVPNGQPIALDPRNSGLFLDGVAITWKELTRWLREMYALGKRFSTE